MKKVLTLSFVAVLVAFAPFSIRAQQAAAGSPEMDALKRLDLPQHRSRQSGRTRVGDRRRAGRPVHLLRVGRQRRRLEDRSTAARPGSRSSTTRVCCRSARSRWRRRIPTSSTSAPARRIRATTPRSATASTAATTAAKHGRTSGSRTPTASRASASTTAIPTSPTPACSGTSGAPSEQRGVFKTTDGGRNWQKVLFKDTLTGCSDIDVNPANSNEVYAGMYTYLRQAWHLRQRRRRDGALQVDGRRHDVEEADQRHPGGARSHRRRRRRQQPRASST